MLKTPQTSKQNPTKQKRLKFWFRIASDPGTLSSNIQISNPQELALFRENHTFQIQEKICFSYPLKNWKWVKYIYMCILMHYASVAFLKHKKYEFLVSYFSSSERE